jgi:hypothetical protein
MSSKSNDERRLFANSVRRYAVVDLEKDTSKRGSMCAIRSMWSNAATRMLHRSLKTCFLMRAAFSFVNLLLWRALRAARTQQDGPSIVIPGSHVRIPDNGVLQDHEAG